MTSEVTFCNPFEKSFERLEKIISVILESINDLLHTSFLYKYTIVQCKEDQ